MPLLDSTGEPDTVYSRTVPDTVSRNWWGPICNEIVGGAAAAADAGEADGGDAAADAAESEADPLRGLSVAPGKRDHSAPTDPRGTECTCPYL